MTTVTTWTGWEANALRKALRMTVTDFAEHVGAARRTVAKWSSRGNDIHLRAEMQAALDTVLTRAPEEAQERFAQLRLSEVDTVLAPRVELIPAVDAGGMLDSGGSVLDQDGGVQRRGLLAGVAISGVIATPAVARLLDVLISPSSCADGHRTPSSLMQVVAGVAQAKTDYQACRYERVLDRVETLLPVVDATRSQLPMRGDARTQLNVLAADLYHVVGSVLLKYGDPAMALMAAERSSRCGQDSGDPTAIGSSARIMTHALMGNGHTRQAVMLAQQAAVALERVTGLGSRASLAIYGALLLRGAIAAARAEDRDVAGTMLDEATRAADRLDVDGNDRWTGFGPNNVLQHRVNVALILGDAGTALDHARRVRIDKITLVERKASLFVDVARASMQWGRREQGLSALRTAYRIAPEEIRSRPVVHRLVEDLAVLSRGPLRTHVLQFAADAGIRL
ncbi:hypothetical protein EV385_6337 [Krasilnikovia cinnamomea]|uniref:Uncharacterized protein n=1 Tax=Krasilnikovia cinnamomea TaxID=349313 RepID=A0A4V2G7Y9_9ACTN|nr:hypothetical protein [Krasilnikovia cinnamomea]RZU54386.1 hypothetical protein EV385_6337 [Krasilnikovia cinnamomea]